MSATQNKETVQCFFERFSETDVEGALALLDAEVVWQAMGLKSNPPVDTRMDRKGIAELIKKMRERMPSGLQLTPTGWTVEGDRVAMEMESYGTKVNGTVYNNFYHFLVTLKDGKITAIREYMDTLHLKQVLIDDI
ncbi:nuclear transport factor 2 family protein [Ruegeria atlantica]|uniref:nuclear transport factor 2 family protein n=1 Tax=Ruegeria atlantica TaxID=81569 RepID=UPI00147F43A5|nr:nuclear transport factor 2 family protein [Ruegeria atlantica]